MHKESSRTVETTENGDVVENGAHPCPSVCSPAECEIAARSRARLGGSTATLERYDRPI